jgi:hypothetical protein
MDIPRITASIEFNGTVRSHPVAATLAWGENREIRPLDGYLSNGTRRRQAGPSTGAWKPAKDLLDLGYPDPPGFVSFHRISHVAARRLATFTTP